MPVFACGATHRANRKTTPAGRSAMSDRAIGRDSYYEDLEYSYVAFHRGIDHRADMRNPYQPNDRRLRHDLLGRRTRYANSEPVHNSTTLQSQLDPSARHTPTYQTRLAYYTRLMYCDGLYRTKGGSLEPPRIGGQGHEVESVGRSRAPRVKARTSQNLKIGGRSRKQMSKFVIIKNPHGDRVRAIVKDETTTFRKVKKKQVREAKKAAGL
ncbi:hypothetical protein HOY80DRAFT_1098725 [Tuber brumale]|nr:hypothetical protein HOY80DRAFT_1098725 [Tuber brumale]